MFIPEPDPGSGSWIRNQNFFSIPDHGSGSRIRIRNTSCCVSDLHPLRSLHPDLSRIVKISLRQKMLTVNVLKNWMIRSSICLEPRSLSLRVEKIKHKYLHHFSCKTSSFFYCHHTRWVFVFLSITVICQQRT